jgi:hypothetical protein
MSNGATFKKITNNDIYKEIQELKGTLEVHIKENAEQHERLTGSAELGKWAAGVAITLALAVLSTLLFHLVRG